MKKFEYYTFYGKHGDETDRMLDHLGNDGWEAFAIVPCGVEMLVYYLKREKSE